ncbi:MAG TPA: Crp/Fnr family transcriptional regulator [Chloroflexia bacterium]|nr:Crp/Fnr family transcriptional regulator [Chloroflexia bacterium]
MSVMSSDEILLSRLPFFAQLQHEELQELSGRLKKRTYRPGETIFHKDDAGTTMYIINEGTVKVSVPSEVGTEMILSILSSGDFFGELSLFDGKPRSATVTSSGTTEVFVLHREDFIDFVSKHPKVSLQIISALSSRIRRTDTLVEDVVFLDIPARLAKKLLELSRSHGKKLPTGSIEIDLRLTQQDIANMLGTTRESVNRQLVAFQERGFISIDRQRITVIKPGELEKRIY